MFARPVVTVNFEIAHRSNRAFTIQNKRVTARTSSSLHLIQIRSPCTNNTRASRAKRPQIHHSKITFNHHILSKNPTSPLPPEPQKKTPSDQTQPRRTTPQIGQQSAASPKPRGARAPLRCSEKPTPITAYTTLRKYSPFDAAVAPETAVYGLEAAHVGVLAADDLLGEPEAAGEVLEPVHRAVVLQLVVRACSPLGPAPRRHHEHQQQRQRRIVPSHRAPALLFFTIAYTNRTGIVYDARLRGGTSITS